MGMFLNTRAPYEAYKETASMRFFIDKTLLLTEVIDSIETDRQKYLCITRPRRFGKSVAANMIAAFFGNTVSARDIFDSQLIASKEANQEKEYYASHLNRYNVVYIDFSRLPRDCTEYAQYIDRIHDGLNQDLKEAYPDAGIDQTKAVWDNFKLVFEEYQERFVFVMDEWDAIFHKGFTREEDKKAYLEFLRDFLKGQGYVELAYMTGVLPIAKYSSGSELNMFSEYDMATKMRFSKYFGFDDKEVDHLYGIYQKTTKNCRVSRDDLAVWYDGYHTAGGERLYNPRSVVSALTDNQISNYWTSSGPYDEIFYYIQNNIEEVRDDIALMISGEHIEMRLEGYSAASTELNTRNQIYSAMVVYGLLTYEEEAGEVFIPNRELMDKYKNLLMSNDSLGYVHRLAKESGRMLRATLEGDTRTMASVLQYAHNTESTILSYNYEAELAAVVNLVYLAARDKYRVEREDKAGKGFVDFIFYPEKKDADALILELKVNASPQEAIQQIKEKEYALRFKGKLGEKPRYTGRILAAGISYDTKSKEHSCEVEELVQC